MTISEERAVRHHRSGEYHLPILTTNITFSPFYLCMHCYHIRGTSVQFHEGLDQGFISPASAPLRTQPNGWRSFVMDFVAHSS